MLRLTLSRTALRSITLAVVGVVVYFGASSASPVSIIALAFVAALIAIHPLNKTAQPNNQIYFIPLILNMITFLYFILPFLFFEKLIVTRFMGALLDARHAELIILFSIGYMLFFNWGFASGVEKSNKKQIKNNLFLEAINIILRIKVVAWVIIATIVNFIRAFSFDSGFPAEAAVFVRLLSVLTAVSIIICTLKASSKSILFAVVIVLYPLYFISSISSGFLAPIISTTCIMFFTYFFRYKKIPYYSVISFFLVIVALMIVKSEFRQAYWIESSRENRLTLGLKYLELAYKKQIDPADIGRSGVTGGNKANAGQEDLEVATRRLLMAPITFSRVITFHESGYREWQLGSTFIDLPLVLLPRVIFPFKPEKNMGQWFGHEYGFLTISDTRTSVNAPQIVETYLNFSWFGCLLAFPLGLLVGLACNWLGGARSVQSVIAVAAALSSLTNIESSISIVYGQLIQILIMLYAVGLLTGSRSRT